MTAKDKLNHCIDYIHFSSIQGMNYTPQVTEQSTQLHKQQLSELHVQQPVNEPVRQSQRQTVKENNREELIKAIEDMKKRHEKDKQAIQQLRARFSRPQTQASI